VNDTLETLAKRIEELESQAAFQDELHESLNAIVARQDGEILELKRQLILLNERIKEFGDAIPGAGPQDETPPHY
jgi:SlyX protein